MKTLGIVLISGGLALAIFNSATLFKKEKVVEIGQLELTREKPYEYTWSPVIGLVVMAVGGVVLWRAIRK